MIDLTSKHILVTGGTGFIGSVVVENLLTKRHVPKENIIIPDSKKDDLRDIANCRRLIKEHNIDVIIHLAALVGGVGFSSTHPATQYYNNILMDLQLVEAAKDADIEKIVLVGSSCAYPKDAPYPLTEDALWTGLPQETNRAYGVAKRMTTVQAESYANEYGMNFALVTPNNAYGPGDNFHPEYSHVIPSLIRKCLEGTDPLIVWGDGTPTRDFLYVKDFAEGVLLGAEHLNTADGHVNLGSGTETRISDLVEMIAKLTGYNGNIEYDNTKPNGQPRRSVDIQKAKRLLDFTPAYSLEDGLKETIAWYQQQSSTTS